LQMKQQSFKQLNEFLFKNLFQNREEFQKICCSVTLLLCHSPLLLCRSSALSLCCCAFQIALSSPDFFCQRYAAMGCGCGQLASNKSFKSNPKKI
jgi:hypothetical protein